MAINQHLLRQQIFYSFFCQTWPDVFFFFDNGVGKRESAHGHLSQRLFGGIWKIHERRVCTAGEKRQMASVLNDLAGKCQPPLSGTQLIGRRVLLKLF